MSILQRTAYFTLSALLVTAVACGGDDSASDDGDDSADDGTTADASDGGDDGADDGADDGDGADAGAGDVELSGTFLLAIEISTEIAAGTVVRAIATISHTPTEEGGTAGTADFSLQALAAEACVPGMGGEPVGEPFAVKGVAVDDTGAFMFTVKDATIPAGAVDVPGDLNLCNDDLTADALVATGSAEGEEGETCGTVNIDALIDLTGTFGSVRVEPGQTGDDNLPKPITACVK
jgi:hypothetical protein